MLTLTLQIAQEVSLTTSASNLLPRSRSISLCLVAILEALEATSTISSSCSDTANSSVSCAAVPREEMDWVSMGRECLALRWGFVSAYSLILPSPSSSDWSSEVTEQRESSVSTSRFRFLRLLFGLRLCTLCSRNLVDFFDRGEFPVLAWTFAVG